MDSEKDKTLLEVFTTSYNEPDTVKRFIEWYRGHVPSCKINVFDNESSDGGATKELCEKMGVRFMTFSTNGKMDESALIMLRNYSWKDSCADFVIVCDSDELVDVTEQYLIDCNNGDKWNLCKCHGVELFGHEDEDAGIFYGSDSPGYNKSVLFHRQSVEHMNFAPGSHSCNPVMREGVKQKWITNINLFHTKWQDWQKGIDRQHAIRDKGIAEDSKRRGWNFHYSLPDYRHEEYFKNGYSGRVRYDKM